jgi:hypothetical protein
VGSNTNKWLGRSLSTPLDDKRVPEMRQSIITWQKKVKKCDTHQEIMKDQTEQIKE